MNTNNWQSITGFPHYEASDVGQIRNAATLRHLSPRTLLGYQRVTVRDNQGKPYERGMHRLVALAFLGMPEAGQEVRHLDGDSLNNRLENLCWGTHSENELDKVAQGTHHQTAKTECPHGHPYDSANTIVDKTRRRCRTCRNNRRRRTYAQA